MLIFSSQRYQGFLRNVNICSIEHFKITCNNDCEPPLLITLNLIKCYSYLRIIQCFMYINLIPSFILKEVEKLCMLKWVMVLQRYYKKEGIIEYDFDKQ